MKCPKCRTANPDGSSECSTCGVQFRDTGRGEYKRSDEFTGQSCCWQAQGIRCMWKGIVSTSTNGSGQWYCREHWARAQGQEPGCIGNELPSAKRMRQTGPKRAPSPLRAMLDAGGPRQFAQLAGKAPAPAAVDPEDVPF